MFNKQCLSPHTLFLIHWFWASVARPEFIAHPPLPLRRWGAPSQLLHFMCGRPSNKAAGFRTFFIQWWWRNGGTFPRQDGVCIVRECSLYKTFLLASSIPWSFHLKQLIISTTRWVIFVSHCIHTPPPPDHTQHRSWGLVHIKYDHSKCQGSLERPRRLIQLLPLLFLSGLAIFCLFCLLWSPLRYLVNVEAFYKGTSYCCE